MVCVVAIAVAWSGAVRSKPRDARSARCRTTSYDSWRSIQGTRLSDDGQWLAYALTSQGEDGELIVRNLKTNQELKHPRGTSPAFTPDGKFVVFTIVPTKADDERNGRGTERRRAGQRRRRRTRRRAEGAANANAPSRNALGIMALPGGAGDDG